MIQWLNNNVGVVTALLTAVYVICTIVLCIFAWRSNGLARKLHEDIHRPVIVCDFFTEHTAMYFRIKNIGMVAARSIRITAEGPSPMRLEGWDKHPAIANGISFLSPHSELVTFFCGPCQCDLLKTVHFAITYRDAQGRGYEDRYEWNLEAWLKEDLGRENNEPMVQELKKIASSLERLTKK